MELLSANLPKNHRILMVGDLHYGSTAVHWKGWKAVMKRLEEENNTFLVLMGDIMESITVDDPRFEGDIHDAREVPLDQAAAIVSDLSPIREKILAVLIGNHELKLMRYGNLIKSVVCKDAKVPYGGFATKLSVKTDSTRYKMFLTHGRLSVRSRADDPLRREVNEQLMVKRRLQGLAGDCAVMATGHCHKLVAIAPTHELFMVDNGKHLVAKYTKGVQHGEYIDPNLRWYVATGSFLKTNIIGAMTYAEKFMLDPVQLGYAELVVEDGRIRRVECNYLGSH